MLVRGGTHREEAMVAVISYAISDATTHASITYKLQLGIFLFFQ